MVTKHHLVLSLALCAAAAFAGCDGCTEVTVEDGGGGSGAGSSGDPFVGTTCAEVCAERNRRWGCDLDVCGDGCSEKALGELRAVGCEQTFIDLHNCTFEVANSCDDGCPGPIGEAMQECIDKIFAYRASMMTTGAGGS